MQLPENPNVRAITIGYPKSGKSGALVSLLKAGYEIVYADFDGNPEVLSLAGEYTKNLTYLPFEDKVRYLSRPDQPRLAGISGEPKSYLRYMEFLETGKYISPDGTQKEDHGPALSWGPEVILVTDSMTRMIDAIWARYLHTIGRSTRRKQDWGAIVEELTHVCRIHTSRRLQCHTIMIAHLQLTGAEEMEEDDKSGGRADLIAHNNAIKQQKADLIGPRLFPRAVTKAQSEIIAALFPVVLPFEVNDNGERIINLTPRKELSVSLPVAMKEKTLPAATGLAKIFEAISGKLQPLKG